MTRGSIQEYTEAVRERYLRASKKGKGTILDGKSAYAKLSAPSTLIF